MVVLGIETSCDETAAAVVDDGGIRSDVIHTQAVHAAYGGVVPELAARAHQEKLVATTRAALDRAGIDKPGAVAATAGPGLAGALLVGLTFGKALALGWGVPFVAVNHLEGHLLSPLLERPAPAFPFLSLLVSGGHTSLVRCDAFGSYTLLGETVDDAAGEAYDKLARMLSLGWPGGPPVDARARTGNPAAVAFPRPDPGGLDWSFSGLKTAVATHLRRPDRATDDDVCASFQQAVVDVLVGRVVAASRQTGLRRVAVAGGVAANRSLRAALQDTGLEVFLPAPSRCTDNGAMIAHAGWWRLRHVGPSPITATADPGMALR